MSLRAVGLWALPLLTAVHATGSPSAPTATVSTRPPPMAPQPTPGISLREFGAMRRRDDTVTSAFWWEDEPNLCGWVGGDVDGAKISCATTATCRYHKAEEFGPRMGCCDDNSVCAFPTVCFETEKISETPALTDTQRPWSIYCTESNAAACVTFVYSDLDITNFGCGPTSDRFEVYTSAFNEIVSGTISRWDQYITPIGDDGLSSYEATFSSTTRTQAGVRATSIASSSRSPHVTETSAAASAGTTKSSTSTGAIAGGVVGGVVGGAAIALAGVFLLLRRKKKNEQSRAAAGAAGHGGAYQSVPENNQHGPEDHAGYSPVEMQPPAEMESSDPSHRMPEAPGDDAVAFSGSKPEMETDRKIGTGSNDFVAELPADSHHEPKP